MEELSTPGDGSGEIAGISPNKQRYLGKRVPLNTKRSNKTALKPFVRFSIDYHFHRSLLSNWTTETGKSSILRIIPYGIRWFLFYCQHLILILPFLYVLVIKMLKFYFHTTKYKKSLDVRKNWTYLANIFLFKKESNTLKMNESQSK